MDINSIVDELNRRFQKLNPEFYSRRIVFWYDEDREFEDQIDDIELDNVQILKLTGSNSFAVKKQLEIDDPMGNYLVYCPIAYDRPDDNWLIDIELYSEEFRADWISMCMDELGITASIAMRKEFKTFKKFFNAKARREKMIALDKVPENPAQLHLAIMAVICGLKSADPNEIIRTVLCGGLTEEENSIYSELVNYEIDRPFWEMAAQGTGYQEEEHSLKDLFFHILMSASSRTLNIDYPQDIYRFISISHQAYCYDFISDWLHGSAVQTLQEYAMAAEDEHKLLQHMAKYPEEDLMDTECFPGINGILVQKLMTSIERDIIDIGKIRQIVEKRKVFVWYDEFACYFEGLLQIANIQQFYLDHAEGFHLASSEKIWKAYTDDYCKMDTYYRLFHLQYEESLKDYNSNLDDLYKAAADRVEGIYKNWFLAGLAENWTNVCADEMEQNGYIWSIPRQTNFYNAFVRSSGSRAFVIISDALRYEVADSLAAEIATEMQGKVKISSMQSVFPTATKYGMAALLPHRILKYAVQGKNVSVLADDMTTDSADRDSVLKKANKDSIAVKYSDIIGMKRAERSELVKGKQVVYVYHDMIDEASHSSDTAVFDACVDAIAEIKNLVKIMVNDFSASNIIITADHGFLYTFSPLTESDKVEKAGFADKIVEIGKRYLLLESGSQPDHLMKIKLEDETSGIEGFAPRENLRMKVQGGGVNFVHGGISLQEMVVPVIEFKPVRSQSTEYLRNKNKYDTKPVEIGLLTATHKISNMLFSLSFYQKDAVSSNRSEARYLVYFVDEDGRKISGETRIIADKTDINGQDRVFKRIFNLKALKYSAQKSYYMVIADENEMEITREEFQITVASNDDTNNGLSYFD